MSKKKKTRKHKKYRPERHAIRVPFPLENPFFPLCVPDFATALGLTAGLAAKAEQSRSRQNA